MSLKAIHILFIVASLLLTLGFGAWELREYAQAREQKHLIMGVGSLVGAVLLVIYGRYVLRKMKHISYL